MDRDPKLEVAKGRFRMRACKVHRAQLNRILEVAAKDIEKADVKLSTTRKGSGITSTITGATVDELLENVKCSTMSGDPERIDNLKIHISAPGFHRESVFITIRDPEFMNEDQVSVAVWGSDPGWVVGRTTQLNDLFAETRPSRIKFISKLSNTRFFSPVIGAVASIIIGAPISLSSAFVHRTSAQVFLFIGLFMFLTGLAYLLTAKIDRLTRTELFIPSPPARPSRDWLNIAVLIATIMGVLVGIAAIIVAHSDAAKANSSRPVHGVEVSFNSDFRI